MVTTALRKVFRRPAYLLLALAASAMLFALAVWLPNLRLVITILGSPDTSLVQKLTIPFSLLGAIATNFNRLAAASTVAIAVLFGVNLALVVYFLRRRIAAVKRSGVATGLLGVASGALGMGCAACGSLLLTVSLTLGGASSILTRLPFGGGEFEALGVLLLVAAIRLTARQIQNPAACQR